MNLRYHGRSFPHRRRNALRRAAADVTDRENAWQAGLQRVARRARHVRRVLCARQNVPPVIQFDTSVEPRRVRLSAYEHEQLAHRQLPCRAGSPVANRHRCEASRGLAMQASSEPTTISTFPSAAIRSTRYRDIEASSPLPLTTIVRRLTWGARNTAACPAELPAPTRPTSSPAQSLASAGDAQ